MRIPSEMATCGATRRTQNALGDEVSYIGRNPDTSSLVSHTNRKGLRIARTLQNTGWDSFEACRKFKPSQDERAFDIASTTFVIWGLRSIPLGERLGSNTPAIPTETGRRNFHPTCFNLQQSNRNGLQKITKST